MHEGLFVKWRPEDRAGRLRCPVRCDEMQDARAKCANGAREARAGIRCPPLGLGSSASSFDEANRSQAAMNSAAITGPITKPLMPNSAMPPTVDISTM